jgi:HSP20 family protein
MLNLELRPYRALNTELDRFFDTMRPDTTFTPGFQILEAEAYFSVSLDLPGLKKEDLNIEVKDNQLTIDGERKSHSKESEKAIRSTLNFGKFSSTFTLPQNVKTEGIEAKFEDGVLTLTIPKEEKALPKKIAINVQ